MHALLIYSTIVYVPFIGILFHLQTKYDLYFSNVLYKTSWILGQYFNTDFLVHSYERSMIQISNNLFMKGATVNLKLAYIILGNYHQADIELHQVILLQVFQRIQKICGKFCYFDT
jgi:hypothetical protein